MKRGLIVFMRRPERGKVKTRLAETIGEERALEVYCRLLAHTHEVAEAVECERYLFYADAVSKDDEWSEERFLKHVQQGPDLGRRMRNAFQVAFDAGCRQVIIIGSDCPGIDAGLIENAFEQLSDNDLVIGPAEDGGYYLLGMRTLHAALFQDKTWSTDAVFSQTMNDITALGLRCCRLPVLTDIDTAADLPAMKHLV